MADLISLELHKVIQVSMTSKKSIMQDNAAIVSQIKA